MPLVVKVSPLVEALAPGAMVMLVVAVVALVIWKLFTVMLAFQPVSVVPAVGLGFHSVFAPTKLTVSVWPGMPEDGDSYQTYGVGGGGGATTWKLPVSPWVPVCTTTVR